MSEHRLDELNQYEIGGLLFRSLLAAKVMGHERVSYTLGSYAIPDGTDPNHEFVYDVLTRRVDDVVDKWFGDEGVPAAFLDALDVSDVAPAPAKRRH